MYIYVCVYIYVCIYIYVYLYVQKLFSLIQSHLFIFAFISLALRDQSKKILLCFMSKSVLPMFSSMSLMVLDPF